MVTGSIQRRMLLTAVFLALAGAAFGADRLPTAAQLLPGPDQFLPGFKRPWELNAENPRYRSEADWIKAHPEYNLTAAERHRQFVTEFRQMPDDVWKAVAARIQGSQAPRSDAPVSIDAVISSELSSILLNGTIPDPTMHIMSHAWREGTANRAACMRLMEEAVRGLEDTACMKYVKFAAPARIRTLDHDPNGVCIEVVSRIYTRPYLEKNRRHIDMDANQLSLAEQQSQQSLDAMMPILINLAANKAENSLLNALRHADFPGNPERIQDAVDDLNRLATAQIGVAEAYNPPIGDGAWIIVLCGPGALERSDKVAQGVAQVRCGRAVFVVNAVANGPYSKDLHRDLERLLEILAQRARAYQFDSP